MLCKACKGVKKQILVDLTMHIENTHPSQNSLHQWRLVSSENLGAESACRPSFYRQDDQ